MLNEEFELGEFLRMQKPAKRAFRYFPFSEPLRFANHFRLYWKKLNFKWKLLLIK